MGVTEPGHQHQETGSGSELVNHQSRGPLNQGVGPERDQEIKAVMQRGIK